jgi:hypothetical protein
VPSGAQIGNRQRTFYQINLLAAVADIPSRPALRDTSNSDFVVPKTRLKLGERVFSVAPLSLGTAGRPYSRLCDRRHPSNAAQKLSFSAPHTMTSLFYCVFIRIFQLFIYFVY